MKHLWLLLLLVACAPKGSPTCPFLQDTTMVTRVVDGDTVCLADGSYIRLIGMNAPEKNEQGYKEAQQYLAHLVLGKHVIVEHQREKYDRYGRELADLYIHGVHVNKKLVEQGMASTMIISPNTEHAVELIETERQARDAGRGLFAKQLNTSAEAGSA